MRTTIRWLLVPIFAALLAGCGVGGPAHGPADSRAAAVIDMGFESFTPATVTIKAGQTIEWRNTSPITHSVSFDPAAAATAGDATLPAGAQAFASGDIAAGDVYLHAFTVPGTYHYFCTHHEGAGMTGAVIVR